MAITFPNNYLKKQSDLKNFGVSEIEMKKLLVSYSVYNALVVFHTSDV